MSLVEPSASASSCIARSVAAAVSASVNSSARRRDPAGAAGQDDHRVVGRQAAVGVDPLEADRPVAVFSAGLQDGGRHDGVGGEDDEHRGQDGREHARRPWPCRRCVQPSRCCTVVLGTESVVMIARAASGPPSSLRACDRGGDPGGQLVHGQPHADQAGAGDGDVDRAEAELRRGVLGGGVGVLRSPRARCRRWRRRS